MEKRNRTIGYGIAGACVGALSLASAAGPCRSGECSACLHCLGIGVVLAATALVKRIRKETTDERVCERK